MGRRLALAKVNGEFAEMRESAMLELDLPKAVDAYGDDRQVQILGQQPNAGLKCHHAVSVAIVDDAFGKHQDAVAAVGGFSGETKTFAEAGDCGSGKTLKRATSRKRKNCQSQRLAKNQSSGG